jgi:transcriptional regulatory protein RtcR
LTQREATVIERFELLYTGKFSQLAKGIQRDIASASPETAVVAHNLPIADAWDFGEVYASLFDFARTYPFDLEQ